nr:reverse transcriptase domain-containing protein [Tanacetum cinerariifolium]
MHTRSSSNLPIESSPNPTSSNPKRRNRRRSKQPFFLKESPIDMIADQRTMTELLRAPTEGYAEAIVVPPILAEQFELKRSLINMMTSDQFFELEKDNCHDHIRWFNKITSTIKYKDVPNSAIKLMLFPFSLARAARQWLKKEPPHSILTWEDLVSKFINEFFPPQERQISCLTAGGNTFLELRDNIQGNVATSVVNYNQEEDERVEETLMDQDLVEYTIKVPPSLVQKPKPHSQRNFVVHQMDPLHLNIPYPSRMLKQKQQEKDEKIFKALFSNKEKLLEWANTPFNENCSAVILKKLPKKLGDPGKFLIPYGFSELKCKALADLGDSINLMSLFVWKKLGLPELISTRMTIELANRAICTPAGIARDVFVLSPLILGRSFLRTARTLIDVYGEEMILCDGDERLTLNMRHDT